MHAVVCTPSMGTGHVGLRLSQPGSASGSRGVRRLYLSWVLASRPCSLRVEGSEDGVFAMLFLQVIYLEATLALEPECMGSTPSGVALGRCLDVSGPGVSVFPQGGNSACSQDCCDPDCFSKQNTQTPTPAAHAPLPPGWVASPSPRGHDAVPDFLPHPACSSAVSFPQNGPPSAWAPLQTISLLPLCSSVRPSWSRAAHCPWCSAVAPVLPATSCPASSLLPALLPGSPGRQHWSDGTAAPGPVSGSATRRQWRFCVIAGCCVAAQWLQTAETVSRLRTVRMPGAAELKTPAGASPCACHWAVGCSSVTTN